MSVMRDPFSSPMEYAELIGRLEIAAAQARSDALRAERQYYRTRDAVLASIGKDAGAADLRAAAARANETVTAAEDAWIEAEQAHNLARAGRDAAHTKWETWRTMSAFQREEMRRLQA